MEFKETDTYLGCLNCGLKFDVDFEKNVALVDGKAEVRIVEFQFRCPRCGSEYIDSMVDIIESWFG